MASSFRRRAAQVPGCFELSAEGLAGGWPGRAGWWRADRNVPRWD